MSFNPSYPSPPHAPRVEHNGPLLKIFLPDRWNPIHVIEALDTGPPHDHPFSLKANILVGGYVETVWTLHEGGGYTVRFNVQRRPGTSHQIDTNTIHLITELPAGYSITEAEPEAAKRPWFFYLPQNDGSVLRSPNFDGPWEPYHPAGPVTSENERVDMARLAPVAAAGVQSSPQVGECYLKLDSLDFIIGSGNTYQQAGAAMLAGHQVRMPDWPENESWIADGTNSRILLVKGSTKVDWLRTGRPIYPTDAAVFFRNWQVLPQIHHEQPTV